MAYHITCRVVCANRLVVLLVIIPHPPTHSRPQAKVEKDKQHKKSPKSKEKTSGKGHAKKPGARPRPMKATSPKKKAGTKGKVSGKSNSKLQKKNGKNGKKDRDGEVKPENPAVVVVKSLLSMTNKRLTSRLPVQMRVYNQPRAGVPEEYKDWDVAFPNYNPIVFTDKTENFDANDVLEDIDLSVKSVDESGNVKPVNLKFDRGIGAWC